MYLHKIINTFNTQVKFSVECSSCHSDDITITDNFCRNCGHKLTKINPVFEVKDVTKILMENMDKLQKLNQTQEEEV